ncbi:oxamate carbamoyltransferase subunit AllH family protein [Enterococcus gilvus]|jgi:hypothetical protein|uniref:DUF2877 domain-containing protein n=1 Tax=Enterococcus gilvus ATCC BAA-350 TaxID=1158614 RepID=R2VC99_9ENTE|nr:DUF2877 domain-containing protein [Enterococcus gilvus]AXG38070.1 DUF2877 domain-containing protein [Enterococcus gilvus]EOI55310.1 hypothetical protein UKC_02517 [Enterococcus gilvus ATCC BAA-350]EOW82147.1 hypothetical protein I592_01449 [Enterococcus gilvus ATCC BAA-350]MBS5820635.1 DUF2877 domain-containing protein [Enterococcus gilvus]OJG43176.1 hypothetical protein RV02_GL003096 [Enterococcus gilvus]
MIYRAIAAGAEVENIVSTNSSKSFSVDRQFENGFTLTNKEQLLYVGNDKKGVLPFGIHLNHSDYQAICEKKIRNCQFERQKDQLYLIDSFFEVMISEKIFYHGTPKAMTVNSVQLKQKIFQLEREELLLGSEFKGEREGTVPAFQKLLSLSPTNRAKGILYYLGRGEGIFPSGDCFLIGLMAVDQVVSIFTNDFYLLLRSFLVQKKWTTALSNTYLNYACKRTFGSFVNSAIDGLVGNDGNWKVKIEELKNLGESSASDILAGMVAGANVYLSKERKDFFI